MLEPINISITGSNKLQNTLYFAMYNFSGLQRYCAIPLLWCLMVLACTKPPPPPPPPTMAELVRQNLKILRSSKLQSERIRALRELKGFKDPSVVPMVVPPVVQVAVKDKDTRVQQEAIDVLPEETYRPQAADTLVEGYVIEQDEVVEANYEALLQDERIVRLDELKQKADQRDKPEEAAKLNLVVSDIEPEVFAQRLHNSILHDEDPEQIQIILRAKKRSYVPLLLKALEQKLANGQASEKVIAYFPIFLEVKALRAKPFLLRLLYSTDYDLRSAAQRTLQRMAEQEL